MLIHNNFSDNFIPYSCTNSCEIRSTFRNSEKITVSLNFIIFNVYVTYYIAKYSIKHLNMTKLVFKLIF